MARLRKATAYRRIERAYTRTSKYRKKAYIRARPNSRVVHYVMGDRKNPFSSLVILRSKGNVQIRDNALEAARQTSNRVLVSKLGKTGFYLRLRTFPHHILRENPLATGAGADRMSTGMKASFGKTIGIAAQTKEGQIIFEVGVPKSQLATAKLAMRRAAYKLPVSCSIEVVE